MPERKTVLRKTHFDNARLARVGLELMTLAELRAKVPAENLAESERVDFFMILVVTEGSGQHLIDFETFRIRRGSVIVVHPGEVQQWRARAGVEGELLLVDPRVAQPVATPMANQAFQLVKFDEWRSEFELSETELSEVGSLAGILRRELDRAVIDDLAAARTRELFLCLILTMARSAIQVGREGGASRAMLYQRLQREIKNLVALRPTVAIIARRLRVSPSTLSRACRAQVGRSAKQAIDKRVALEAQRLLVHSGAPAAEIGEQMGFSEPTNFVKFFKRQVGVTPDRFRRHYGHRPKTSPTD